MLEREISAEEISITLKDCDGSKAPGPDGFNMKFFKKFWYQIKEEVVDFMDEFWRNGRPISLVNSIYKLLAKCLAKRLSEVLPHLISQNQTAFIANRSILDGIMVTNELIHALKSEKGAALIIKLDFRRAYDSVSWEYLESIQKCMGFGFTWRKWMKECYSTVKLAVLVNGSPTKFFPLERGLRQGDPLSPFLFLLAAEGLSRIFNKASEAGKFEGVAWTETGERITHLQFADDTIIFCKAEWSEVQNLKRILQSLEGCSGLKINYSKSLCFGVGLEEEESQRFAEVLRCPVGKFSMNYLGIQVGGNPAKRAFWDPIIQRFKQKLGSWRSANLSMAGRVVLIKSALCSIPLYQASIYKMPSSVSQEMEKIQRSFLWGGSESRRKIHYVKWDTVKKPKRFGGLGILGLVEMNLALLAKWWWKLASGNGGLWRRMIIEKYDFKRARVPANTTCRRSRLSNTWRNIFKSVQGVSEIAYALSEGMKLKVGRGDESLFWEDSWSGEESFRVNYPRMFQLAVNKEAKVEEMGQWVDGVWQWQVILRRPLYQWEEEIRLELMEGLSHIHLNSKENDRIGSGN
ncbi:hypothetical protein QQ045_002972 [Rhodiola kirilowii]